MRRSYNATRPPLVPTAHCRPLPSKRTAVSSCPACKQQTKSEGCSDGEALHLAPQRGRFNMQEQKRSRPATYAFSSEAEAAISLLNFPNTNRIQLVSCSDCSPLLLQLQHQSSPQALAFWRQSTPAVQSPRHKPAGHARVTNRRHSLQGTGSAGGSRSAPLTDSTWRTPLN